MGCIEQKQRGTELIPVALENLFFMYSVLLETLRECVTVYTRTGCVYRRTAIELTMPKVS